MIKSILSCKMYCGNT